jgi:hypothetical protein
MRFKLQQEHHLQLPRPPSPRRTRQPPQHETTRAPDNNLKTIVNILFFFPFFQAPDSSVFLSRQTTHTTSAAEPTRGTHPVVDDTSGRGTRQKESSSLLLELPKRSGVSKPQGRIPPAREAVAGGEAAAQDLTVFTEVDETQAHDPRNGDT